MSDIERQAVQKVYVMQQPKPKPVVPRVEFAHVREMLREPAPVPWAIDGVLIQGTMAALIGAPASFKSAAMIDMAACISTGTPWHEREARQGAVFYLAGEGNRGLIARLKAWEITNRPLEMSSLFLSRSGAGLSDPLNAAAVADEVRRMSDEHRVNPVCVCVDTLARNFGPGDENSTADMGRFIENIDRHIREPFSCLVALAHHTGHGDASRGRGSSSLRAALDTEILFERQGDSVVMRCTKSKDAVEFEPMAFQTRLVTLPWNGDDGQPEVSFVLEPGAIPTKQPEERFGKHEVKLIATLERMYEEAQERLTLAGRDPKQALVSIKEWRKECADVEKNRFYDARASLEKRGRIVIEHPHVRLATDGVPNDL